MLPWLRSSVCLQWTIWEAYGIRLRLRHWKRNGGLFNLISFIINRSTILIARNYVQSNVRTSFDVPFICIYIYLQKSINASRKKKKKKSSLINWFFMRIFLLNSLCNFFSSVCRFFLPSTTQREKLIDHFDKIHMVERRWRWKKKTRNANHRKCSWKLLILVTCWKTLEMFTFIIKFPPMKSA